VHEEKDSLPWDSRFKTLERITNAYRNKSGNSYDCIVPVSGGGDSYFITHIVTKVLGLNPLLVTYNHQYNTKVGIRNLANLLTVFDCDHVSYNLNPDLVKKITRYTLKKFGSMYWHVLAGRSTFPVQIAVKFKVPLIIWGVNGWCDQVGMFSHLDEVEMTKKVRKEHSLMCFDAESIIDEEIGISRPDIQRFIYPFDSELEKVGVRGIYLGNYIRWDSKKQHEKMIEAYGYETARQERTFNTYEDVDCFHSAGLHDYIKFLKYGYGKVTDHASREIRLRRMTREEGIDMVRKYGEHVPKDVPLFLDWIGMKDGELFRLIDAHRDRRIWQQKGEGWELKDSVLSHVNDEGIDNVRLEKEEDCHFKITPSREPDVPEDHYVLMGRGYINKYNYQAVDDNQDQIQKELPALRERYDHKFHAIDDGDGNRSDLTQGDFEYCSRCVMPNTKPGVFLDSEGVCSACRSVEQKGSIDWSARAAEFESICNEVRGSNGNGYECLVPVSGGKDSQYQAWLMSVVQKLNVLAVCVVPHLQTREGIANLNTLLNSCDVDLIKITLKPSVFQAIRRKKFVANGEPNWADHCSVISGVTRMAYLYQIPLIVWGEDIAVEFGGRSSNTRKASAQDIDKSDLVMGQKIADVYDEVITAANTFFYKYPSAAEWEKTRIRSIYIGYFFSWDGFKNYRLAKKHGFQRRKLGSLSGNILAYDNIDEKLCEINIWFKFLKFGFWRPTDQCCYHIWNKRMKREKAIDLVEKRQYEIPVEYIRDFLEFHNIGEETFWETVNKFMNRRIWEKKDGRWKLRVRLNKMVNAYE